MDKIIEKKFIKIGRRILLCGKKFSITTQMPDNTKLIIDLLLIKNKQDY